MRFCLTLSLMLLCLYIVPAEAEPIKQLGPEVVQNNSRPMPTGGPVIAVFGDGLVAGYGLPLEDALPAQLKAKLHEDGIDAIIFNDGISGDTTAGGRGRVSNVINQHPAVAIILFGGNDLLRALPPEAARDNLDAIMAAFQKAGIKMMLIGMKAPLSLGPAYTSPFNALYPDLAQKYHAAFYPVYFAGVYGNDALMQADGIHPNQKGVTTIVEKLEPQIVSLLKQ